MSDEMMSRRSFVQQCTAGSVVAAATMSDHADVFGAELPEVPKIDSPQPSEDIFAYIQRVAGEFDATLYTQILGAANEYKEGDEIIGVSAADPASRANSRALLAATRTADIDAHPIFTDDLAKIIQPNRSNGASQNLAGETFADLKLFLLDSDQETIKKVMPGLSSDVIACVVKLMDNDELIRVGRKVFNALPGSQIGAEGYLSARVQPNSPTDNTDDIRWQVFSAWSYGVGDALLGNNPVSSEPESVVAIENTLKDLLVTFEIEQLMPHCVLAHVDVQAEVEAKWPGSTALWFQSIAGCDDANETFDISVEKMRRYAAQRTGRFGMYFETGQGADFTNGHGHGFDMVIHESRKYGFARKLADDVAKANGGKPWVHLNDVAGFIGPEVFRTREQLVRCCLEDIVMGKLHGLCIGLDVCSTLHMDVSLDDLDWCLEQIAPANPAYLMALPTKIDPMLGYLTTGYQDHVRLREKFAYKVNDATWAFFQELGVIDQQGKTTKHFGDPLWVHLQYQKRKGDRRSDDEILREGQVQLAQVRSRGVFVAAGHGERLWDLESTLNSDIRRIYDDAKISIRAELDPQFIESIPGVVEITTQSQDRDDYILHPTTGEVPDDRSTRLLKQLRRQQANQFNVQIMISDGLNALSIMQAEQLMPFIDRLRQRLAAEGFQVAPQNLVATSGRVRCGYRVGETLFGGLPGERAILHIIGERPGTGHRTFSTYISTPSGDVWGKPGEVDHNITKVVSGIATTALQPTTAADDVVRILRSMI
jgi:ethanolamine ammonia-lyase large subunit